MRNCELLGLARETSRVEERWQLNGIELNGMPDCDGPLELRPTSSKFSPEQPTCSKAAVLRCRPSSDQIWFVQSSLCKQSLNWIATNAAATTCVSSQVAGQRLVVVCSSTNNNRSSNHHTRRRSWLIWTVTLCSALTAAALASHIIVSSKRSAGNGSHSGVCVLNEKRYVSLENLCVKEDHTEFWFISSDET